MLFVPPSTISDTQIENQYNKTTLWASKLTRNYFRFGVLQLRLHRLKRLHFEVVASEVGRLDIL